MKKDVKSLTKLIYNYSVEGKLNDACNLFDKMSQRDCVAYNVMMKSLVENDRLHDARNMFDAMPIRNSSSWNSMIVAYIRERKISVALKLFLTMPGYHKDTITWTTMIVGLARNSRLEDAWRLFSQIPMPDIGIWSSIIASFQQQGLAIEAIALFRQMLREASEPNPHCLTSALAAASDLGTLNIGQQLYSQVLKRGFDSNTHVCNSAISMFIESGSLFDAKRVLNFLAQTDISTWNSVITGYGRHGYGEEAIMVFHQMQKAGFHPDGISYMGVFQGCSHCGLVEEGRKYFRIMEADWKSPPCIDHYACMVDVFSRSGMLKEAIDLIKEMPFEPTIVFWRTMLNGCRTFGNLELGLSVVGQVLKSGSDTAAVWMMMINMFTSAGNLDEARKMRTWMGGINPRKDIGYSWIETQGRINLFTANDETHQKSDYIYWILELLNAHLVEQFSSL